MHVAKLQLGSVDTKPLLNPKPLKREEFFPASYIYKPDNDDFMRALEREAMRRAGCFDYVPPGAEGFALAMNLLRAQKESSGSLTFLPIMKCVPAMPGEPQDTYLCNVIGSGYVPPELPKIPRRRGPKSKNTGSETFVEIHPYANRFFFCKAVLHPYFETYSFEDISRITSALWSDTEHSYASDYFTFLSRGTFMTPATLEELEYVHIWDYDGSKPKSRDSKAEVSAIVEAHREKTELKLGLRDLEVLPSVAASSELALAPAPVEFPQTAAASGFPQLAESFGFLLASDPLAFALTAPSGSAAPSRFLPVATASYFPPAADSLGFPHSLQFAPTVTASPFAPMANSFQLPPMVDPSVYAPRGDFFESSQMAAASEYPQVATSFQFPRMAKYPETGDTRIVAEPESTQMAAASEFPQMHEPLGFLPHKSPEFDDL